MSKKEMAYPPGLVLHGGTYRVQKRVPQDCLQHYDKAMLYFRTEQSSKRDAAPIAWKWLAEWEDEFDRIRKTGTKHKSAMTEQEMERICDLMLISRLEADEESRGEGDLVDDHGFARHLETLEDNEQASREALGRGRFERLKESAQDWLTGYGYDLAPESDEMRRFIFKFAKKTSEANKAVRARDEGEVVETPSAPKPAAPIAATTTQKLMLST